MHRVKQSTSFEFDFRALDSSNAAVTGKVTGDWTKRIKQAGGAWGAMTVTITEGENGWYYGVLSSSHTSVLGALAVHLTATGVSTGGSLVFTIEANNSADVVALLPTSLDSGNMRSAVKAMDAGIITATVIATDAIDADSLKADAVTEITSGLATATNVSAVTTAISALLPSALAGGYIQAKVMLMDTDVISAAAVAAAAVTKIVSGIATATNVSAVTTAISALLPSSLDGGLMRSQVKGMDTDVISAAATSAAAVSKITSGLATAAGVTSAVSALATAAAVAALPSAVTIATAVLDSVTEGSRTVRGVLRRMDGLVTGKLTGLLSSLFTIYAADGTTKLVEATQSTAAGTRETASTVAGD